MQVNTKLWVLLAPLTLVWLGGSAGAADPNQSVITVEKMH